MNNAIAVFLVIALVVIALILSPLITLWALNTISEEAKMGWYIPHTIWTYIPIWVLTILWRGSANVKKS